MVLSNALTNRMNFFPKFDNLGRESSTDVLALLQPGDVVLFTKKHSGSLLLVSAKMRAGQARIVANSKNSTNTEFTRTAEHYLRAQFAAVFGDSDCETELQAFADFCWSNTASFCFEWVTACLGDHAEVPRLPYMVLTAISFTSPAGATRFASLPEVVDLAVQFRLILNEMWALRSLERIGDHACNIAEHVVYLVQGLDVRHGRLDELEESLTGR